MTATVSDRGEPAYEDVVQMVMILLVTVPNLTLKVEPAPDDSGDYWLRLPDYGLSLGGSLDTHRKALAGIRAICAEIPDSEMPVFDKNVNRLVAVLDAAIAAHEGAP